MDVKSAFLNGKFILYQMDVKSAFLNGYIMEEVHVKQPPRFENFDFPPHVYQLKKSLYGLNKLQELGTIDLVILLLRMISKWVSSTLFSLLKLKKKICY